ncbi:hypothetical protein AVEN_158854-1 [Araneus ventricosus]|uniref:Uncharacterized protein n=1 Tax=Araneus ventricosus TaxID=182803 RepID=A0A4Y2E7M7_ARAVE|nr:hypothetical protein AVEN_158854-1 [Araneus ventricosus]
MISYARSTRIYCIWLLEEQKLTETCNVRFDEIKRSANGILKFPRTNSATKECKGFKVNEPFNSLEYDEDSKNSVRAYKTLSSDDSNKFLPVTKASNLKSCSSIPVHKDAI